MERYYPVFGVNVPAPTMLIILAGVGLGLTLFKFRTLLLVTLLALILPNVCIHLIASPARLLRWAFLGGFVLKGLIVNVSRRRAFVPTPLSREHWTLLMLSALAGISILWSIGPTITFLQFATIGILWLGAFLLLWNSWSEPEDLLDVCHTLFVLATLVFLPEGIFQLFGLGHTGIAHGRYAGIFANPNSLGTAVAFLGPFVYWKHRVTESNAVKILARVLGLIMVSSLLLSGSRSGLLGCIVCLSVIVTYVHRARAAVAAMLIVPPLLITIVLAPGFDTEVLHQTTVGTRVIRPDSLSTLSDRVELWKDGFTYFRKKPFLGWGYGMDKFARYGRANVGIWQAMYKLGNLNYHNSYLQMGLDLGVTGVTLFFFFVLSTAFRGLRIFRAKSDAPVDLAGMAFFGSYLALFGDSFVHGWAFAPGNSMCITFWVVSAAVIRVRIFGIEREAAEIEEADEEDPGRGLAGEFAPSPV